MRVNYKIEFNDKDRQELVRLLNNGGELPELFLSTVNITGAGPDDVPNGQYVNRSHLVKLLTDLAEMAISDQKQEAYRGLRKIIERLQ